MGAAKHHARSENRVVQMNAEAVSSLVGMERARAAPRPRPRAESWCTSDGKRCGERTLGHYSY